MLAFVYNRAFLMADSSEPAQRQKAAAAFERYLGAAEPSSPWWPLAFERYQSLCRELNRTAKTRQALVDPDRMPDYRLATEVTIGTNRVSLGEPVSDVTGRLGEGEPVPVVRGTDLVRRKYPASGMELLTADRVLAIFLGGANAPPLSLLRPSSGAGAATLHVGMTKAELEQVFAGKESTEVAVDRPGERYRYFPDPGVGARLARDKVTELVVTQMPRREKADEK
jgi:hypothetical protein